MENQLLDTTSDMPGKLNLNKAVAIVKVAMIIGEMEKNEGTRVHFHEVMKASFNFLNGVLAQLRKDGRDSEADDILRRIEI